MVGAKQVPRSLPLKHTTEWRLESMHQVHQIQTNATDQRDPKAQNVQQALIWSEFTSIIMKCCTSGTVNVAVRKNVFSLQSQKLRIHKHDKCLP